MAEVTPVPNEDFESAFAQFSNPETANVATPAPEPADEAPAEPAEEVGQEAAAREEHPPAEQVGDDNAGGADDDAEPPVAEAEGQKPEERDEVLKRFADLIEQERKEKAERERQQLESAKQQQTQQSSDKTPEIFTPDEVKALTEFEKDYPDVAQAVQIISRVNQDLMANFIFKEVNKFLQPKLELLEALAHNAQLSELTSAIPQLNDEYQDRLVSWAKSEEHPEFLRKAYERVITEGSVDEIKYLVSEFEKATGTRQSAKSSRKAPEPPPLAKQAAKSLAPVSAKRSVQSAQPEPQSFEEAFALFSRQSQS